MERRVTGEPAAGVECPTCGQTTDDQGACECAPVGSYWAASPIDRLREAIQAELDRDHPEILDDAEYRGYFDGLRWVLSQLDHDGDGS